VLDEPAVIAVLTWGLSDRYTWLSEFKPICPLPLNSQLNCKLALNAMAQVFAFKVQTGPYIIRYWLSRLLMTTRTFAAIAHKEDIYVAECLEVLMVDQGASIEEAISTIRWRL